jgi:phospholipid/cholesterol/gamma-HCH transport system substrate-binding protein
MRRFLILGGVLVLVVAAGAWFLLGNSYTVKVALPSATNIVKGGTLQLNGWDAGEVKSIEARDDQAILTLSIKREYAPLHEGTVITVPWKAVLGERIVEITDGPATNATIPDGGLIKGQMAKPTEVDQVLNALDAPTLKHLTGLVGQLDTTFSGHEADLNATLNAAGPALQSLGGVLDALGTDGPAIQELAVQLDKLTGAFANHQTDVRSIVSELTRLTSLAASRQDKFRDALHELPPTLRAAKGTLDKVPPVADKTIPLLNDLEPGTRRLKHVANNLNPLLHDLRPAIRDLRPTLRDLSRLLDRTPGLLRNVNQTLPDLSDSLQWLQNPVNFLRPFTPEAMGWLSNWDSMFPINGNGRMARINVQQGLGEFNNNPGLVPPGYRMTPYQVPGQLGGTPWTDAFGSGVR